MIPIEPSQLTRLEMRCPHQDEHKLIELLLNKDVPVFDLWQAQRYGIPAHQLNLIEQVKGFTHYTYASCVLPYSKALDIKHALHQQIAQSECNLLLLISC